MNNSSCSKQGISEAFNKAWRTYDAHCTIQKASGEILINKLKFRIKAAAIIVDFGCGTGLITESLAKELNYQQFYVVDISEKLLMLAQQRLTGKYQIESFKADFEEIIFENNTLDLAFSNLALQWSTSLELPLKRIFDQLKPQGILAFTLPLKGSLSELRSESCNSFYELQEVEKLLLSMGYTLLESQQIKLVENFPHPLLALKSLKAVGANYVTGRSPSLMVEGKASIAKIIKQACVQSKKYELSYQIGFFIAQKNLYEY